MAAKPSAANPNMSSDPRIAPKELIVTRRIAAQLRRQLRSGDRSMKRLTQLLKSPERSKPLTVNKTISPSSLKTYKNTTTKQKTSPKGQKLVVLQRISLPKSPRKRKVTEKVESKEFYPKKVKRKINNKTVTLKPKHELTKVHSLNKRKLTTPRKGMNSRVPTPTNPPTALTLDPTPSSESAPLVSPAMTVGELVNKCNDEDSLTNEDLIEILTCPSPVWWEDPPDGSFSEDPIPTNLLGKRVAYERKLALKQSHIVEDTSAVVTRTAAVKENSENTATMAQKAKSLEEKIAPVDVKIELTKRDDKFIKKRSTLEGILSCIKTKSTSNKSPPQQTCGNTNEAGSRVSTITNTSTKFDSIDQVLKDNRGMLKKSIQKHKPSILKMEPKRKEELVDIISADSNTQGSNDDIFADMREDELLNDLENLEIPIGTSYNSGIKRSTRNEPEQCIVLDNDVPTSFFFEKSELLPEDNMKATLVEGPDELTFSGQCQAFVPPSAFSTAKTTVWARKEDKKKNKTHDTAHESKAVPEDMPPLRQYSKLTETKMASPGNLKCESGESDFESCSVVSGQDVDTISDTNVKYLNDDQISDYEGSDRVKCKTEADSGLSVSEDNKTVSIKKEETSIVAMETDSFIVEGEKSENNTDMADIIAGEKEDSKQKMEVPDPETEGKKGCIIVYKITETVSESIGDRTNDESILRTKSKRVVNVKRSSNKLNTNMTSPKSMPTDPDERSSPNNINDMLKQCKQAYLKTPNVKRTKCRNQKVSKAVHRKGNAVSVLKKREGESTENQTETKKYIAVTNTKTVNYCLKCSSIFETKACNYCVMKT